jgi:hypothetical protein
MLTVSLLSSMLSLSEGLEDLVDTMSARSIIPNSLSAMTFPVHGRFTKRDCPVQCSGNKFSFFPRTGDSDIC